MFSKTIKNNYDPNHSDASQFDLQILKKAPILEINDVDFFVPRIVVEFAKYLDPNKMHEIGKFLIDGYSHHEVHYQNLIIIYKELYDKENYKKLAGIFNNFNPDFDAHYTIIKYNNRDSKQRTSFYALCLNKNAFLNHAFSTIRIRHFPVENKSFNIYRKTSNNVKVKDKPKNHYPIHKFDVFINQKRSDFNNTINANVELAILDWQKTRELDCLFNNLFNYTLHLMENFPLIPKEILLKISFFMIIKLAVEYNEKGLILTFSEFFKFKNLYVHFSIEERERNLLKLITDVLEFKMPESEIVDILDQKSPSERSRRTDQCVFADDSVVFRFTNKNHKEVKHISETFLKIFTDKNEFTIEKFKYGKQSSFFSDTTSIYVSFPFDKYGFFEKACKKILTDKQVETIQNGSIFIRVA